MKIVATQFMRFRQLVQLGKKIGLSTLVFFAIPTASVEAQVRLAQITPDESLPTTVEQLQEIMRINGGERAGNNLFHSFEEFSISEGMEAIFENATDIENIFTRITGESISNIDGVLRTQGGANLFLVNPNGIIFGKNAQLDVGGSFIATTADSIQFEGGAEFVANGSISEPTITIDRPIGLAFGNSSGAIQVNGTGHQIVSDTRFSPIGVGDAETGLSVNTGKTLALIGGEITFPGGVVSVEGGRIEVGSVNSGLIGLQEAKKGFAFSYGRAIDYQDISLSEQALLNVSGEEGGTISLNGNNILLSGSSFLLNQNRGNTDSGNINVNSVKSLILSGTTSDQEVSSNIRSESLESGKGAKISIDTKQLSVLDEALIIASSYGEADGNDLTINASDSVEIVDSSVSASTFAEGNAGNLNLSTSHLQVKNSGGFTSSTIATGNGGNVTVNASLIEVIGGSSSARSNISASSFNAGNAGNVTVDTEKLRIQDGGAVSSSAFAEGNAGSLVIKASESVEVSGRNQNFGVSSPESAIRTAVQAASPGGQRALGLPAIPTGNSGSLTLETPFLRVSQQGTINVENEGTGNGGTLSINADRLNLKEAGSITAATTSGTGGNINLVINQIQIDDNSSITATAENDGDGGNVTINTTALLAKKNSEITANAFAGTGGNIQIDTKGLFLFPDSNIEASSELGIDGTVEINTLDNNLQKDLEISELILIVNEDSLANSCLARRNSQQGSFVINNGNSLLTTGESGFYDSGSITGMNNFSNNSQVDQLPITEPQSLENLIPAEQAVKTESGRTFLVSAPQSVQSLICN